jgi:hypothetical protein
VDLVAGLGRALVDLVAEPTAGLPERPLSLLLGQLGLVADLVFDLLGGRRVSGRGRPERGISHQLPFHAVAAGRVIDRARLLLSVGGCPRI